MYNRNCLYYTPTSHSIVTLTVTDVNKSLLEAFLKNKWIIFNFKP